MKSKNKIIASVLIIFIGAWVYFHYFFDLFGECKSDIFLEKTSSQETYIAKEVIVDCGATSDYSTQIIVENTATGINQTVLSIKGDQTKSCNIEWDDGLFLNVSCKGNIDVYNQIKEFEKVKINFYLNDILE